MKIFRFLTRKGRLRFVRYRSIFSTLVFYGFGEIAYQTGIGKFFHLFRRNRRRTRIEKKQITGDFTTYERIRMAIEQLGPTFIKLGQILSNRPDLIPQELQSELEKLQTDVRPFSSDEAISIVENELNGTIEELFLEFDRTPVASASIAQLHRAVLPGGEAVAVKIERPGLQELVEVDVDILKEVSALLERYFPESRKIGPRDIVEEFEKGILQEIDLHRESIAIEHFARQFKDDSEIKIPKLYKNYSTQRVLTMEFINGKVLSQVLQDGTITRDEGSRIAKLGANLTLKQIFTHGFFHGDPHPGNIMVLEDGRLCYIDFGLTGSLIQRDLEIVSDILISIIGRNEQKAARAVVKLSGSRNFETAQSIEREIAELIDRFQSARAGDFSFTNLLSELVEILVRRGLQLPSNLFLLVKALITIEGVATGLDPDFNFTAHLEPFAENLIRDRYDPQRLKRQFSTTVTDYMDILQNLPLDYHKMVHSLSSGQMRVSIDEKSIRSARKTILQASSALVFAIVLSSLIIGSAVIVHSQVPPLWHQIPIIGIVGFIVAGLIGFWLLIKIIRTGGF